MSRHYDFEIESGPYIVLSDGSTFDYAYECELSYMSRAASSEILDVQNRGWHESSGPGMHFDSAAPEDIYSIPLREIIRFYFENKGEEDPMR